MKHTKLSQEETDQLIKNIQMGVELDDSFKTIKWNYSYNLGFENDTLLNRGFTPSESKALLERAMFSVCLKYDFRENGSLWAATKYQIKTELVVEMDSMGGKGIMSSRNCHFGKGLNPYTCNNECGMMSKSNNLPCRINIKKGVTFSYLDLEDKSDKYSNSNKTTARDVVEKDINYSTVLAPETNTDLMPPLHSSRMKSELIKAAEKKAVKAINDFPPYLKQLFWDFISIGSEPMSISELSAKYEKPKSVIEDLIEEGFLRLCDNNISHTEFGL